MKIAAAQDQLLSGARAQPRRAGSPGTSRNDNLCLCSENINAPATIIPVTASISPAPLSEGEEDARCDGDFADPTAEKQRKSVRDVDPHPAPSNDQSPLPGMEGASSSDPLFRAA